MPKVRAILWGCFCGATLAVLLKAAYILAGPNLYTVIPGEVYRCAQPSEAQLERLVRRLNVRTVVNLRGCSAPDPWYLAEVRAANRLGVSHEDLSLSAGRLPSTQNVRHLVNILDRSEPPILFHCNRGADRTGLASTMAVLLKTDASLDEARRQLLPWFGHLAVGRMARIDEFFDLYEEWLGQEGIAHSRDAFRRWATEEYCPGPCRCRIEVLGVKGHEPLRFPVGQPGAVRVRCTNNSIRPWALRPGPDAGIHLAWKLLTPDGVMVADGRSGLFAAVVPPGEGIELTVPLPAVLAPGRYRLRLDMIEEQHGFFLQMGTWPVEWEVVVS
jgi:protein tyrosine phosphatase (PTP) superfamily phosphohydrolase (DUF442 family)